MSYRVGDPEGERRVGGHPGGNAAVTIAAAPTMSPGGWPMTPERQMVLGAALVLLAGAIMVLRGAWVPGATLLIIGATFAMLTIVRRQ